MSKFMPDALNNNIPGMSMATGLVDKAEGGLNDNVPGMSHVTGGLDQVMDKTKEGVGQVPGANMVQDNMNKGMNSVGDGVGKVPGMDQVNSGMNSIPGADGNIPGADGKIPGMGAKVELSEVPDDLDALDKEALKALVLKLKEERDKLAAGGGGIPGAGMMSGGADQLQGGVGKLSGGLTGGVDQGMGKLNEGVDMVPGASMGKDALGRARARSRTVLA